MFYGDKPIYRIGELEPRTDISMGRYGFSVGIDADVAKKALEIELPKDVYERLGEIGKEIIVSTGLDKKDSLFLRNPYYFVKNNEGNLTWLLNWIQVYGDACTLGTDGEQMSLAEGYHTGNFLGYYPHNIDYMSQAYTLLALWLRWADGIELTLMDKD